MPGRQHVIRLMIGIVQMFVRGQLPLEHQLGPQSVSVMPPPLVSGIEVDDRLGHVERRWIGGRVGGDFRHRVWTPAPHQRRVLARAISGLSNETLDR